MEKVEWKLLFQGAESRISTGVYNSLSLVKKERFEKHYRHPDLDLRLTKERIKAEVRAVMKIKEKCNELGRAMPTIFMVTQREIYMSLIDNARNVSQVIESESTNVDSIFQSLADIISKIHMCEVIHGDLTTSNFMVNSANQIVPIDFGLSSFSTLAEDRAVDLYVLERAIQSTHLQHASKFDEIFLPSYKGNMGKSGPEILKKLDEVRTRGRKRQMVG